MKTKKRTGFTYIEVIFSTLILVVTVTAVFTVKTKVTENSTTLKNISALTAHNITMAEKLNHEIQNGNELLGIYKKEINGIRTIIDITDGNISNDKVYLVEITSYLDRDRLKNKCILTSMGVTQNEEE